MRVLLWIGILSLAVFVALILFFYRKPTIQCYPYEKDTIRSPAYGRIIKIKRLPGDRLFLAIFLSPLDIHYQVAPCNGQVLSVRYDATGKFELAYNETKSRDNEKAIITLDTNMGVVQVYQIAGKLVRSIDTYNKQGDQVVSGNLIGMIKLGSRVDLILPHASRFQLKVEEGMRVNGSSTIIGSYDSHH